MGLKDWLEDEVKKTGQRRNKNPENHLYPQSPCLRHRWTFLTIFWSFPSRYCTGIWNLICSEKALFNSLLSRLLLHIPSKQQTLFTRQNTPSSQFSKLSHQQQFLSCISHFQFNHSQKNFTLAFFWHFWHCNKYVKLVNCYQKTEIKHWYMSENKRIKITHHR